MRIGIATREWPPEIYGGAGVHVEHLVAALCSVPAGPELTVHCFGDPQGPLVAGAMVVPHAVPWGLRQANGALQALGVDVEIANALAGVDLVHSHTWYANTAGQDDAEHMRTATHGRKPNRSGPWLRREAARSAP